MVISMVQTPSQSLTLEAFLALPETKPASEFAEGHIFSSDLALTVGKIFGWLKVK